MQIKVPFQCTCPFDSIPAPALRLYLKLKCNSCGEVPDHWQYVSQEERVAVKVKKKLILKVVNIF